MNGNDKKSNIMKKKSRKAIKTNGKIRKFAIFREPGNRAQIILKLLFKLRNIKTGTTYTNCNHCTNL